MSEPLVVRLSGVEVGELLPTGGLRWSHDWSQQAPLNARVLSHSLPFGAPAVDPAPFFGGLLPEGIGLERLAREVGAASNDLFGLLSEVGSDVGGSVTIGEPRPPLDPIVIEETEYDRILERAAGYIRKGVVGGGGSAATGVQPKIPLTWDTDAEAWLIGRGSIPSTHLLKPASNEYAQRLRAEAYLNDIAAAMQLSHHSARVESAADRTVLVVERYDRVRTQIGVQRVHQEDASQALALPWGGNDKYESVNPRASLAHIAALLAGPRLSGGLSDRERLLMLVTLNVVAGNTDAHAKNFSFMLPSLDEAFTASRALLADAYDLVPQVLFSAERDPLAMRINGKSESAAIHVDDLIAEGRSWGLPSALAEAAVQQALQAAQDAVERLGEAYDVSPRLPAFLHEQCQNLLKGDGAWTKPLPPAVEYGPL